MAVRFVCEHCDQLLSVGERKIGCEAKCPKCQATIVVPTLERAAAMLESRRMTRPEPQDDPFSEFVVYDEVTELVYEQEDERLAQMAADEALDRQRVAVPRVLLYAQGALLGLLGIVAFLLGFAAGRGTSTPPPQIDLTLPCVVAGELLRRNANDQPVPDDGAVVIIVPSDRTPEWNERVAIDRLRPDEPLPPGDHAGLSALRVLGGAYVRAGADGRFQVTVPRSGRYYVLLLSRHAQRDAGDRPKTSDLAQLGRYFDLATDLLGRSRYAWREVQIRGDSQLPPHDFGAAL
jgi:phage FluMu protein Com